MTDNLCNKDNPQLFGIIQLLEEMCRKCLLGRDPKNYNNIIIYRTGVETETGETVDGWFSQNIFDTAQELYDNKESFDSLCAVLKTKGFVPIFTPNGEFKNFNYNVTDKGDRLL